MGRLLPGHVNGWVRRHPVFTAAACVVIVTAFNLAWIGAYAYSGRNVAALSLPGQRFMTKSHSSHAIDVAALKVLPASKTAATTPGYDGQFYYYLALDPIHAKDYMDQADYRYTRVLYPVMARLLSLGNPDAIPYSLILLNAAFLVSSVFLLSLLLAEKKNAGLPLFVVRVLRGSPIRGAG